jgi:hypothetical protein
MTDVGWSDPAAGSNFAALQDKARNALASNAVYLAIPTPTQAQAVQQVERLTRQVNGLMRVFLGYVNNLGDT